MKQLINESVGLEILEQIKKGITQQGKIAYAVGKDSSVVRNLASKLVVEGRLMSIKINGKIFYRVTKPSSARIINTDQTYVMKEILREVRINPNKSIGYISDKVSSRGIGKGYWSNQKLIHKLEDMGYITLRRSSNSRTTIKTTAEGEKYLYNGKVKATRQPAERGPRFRIDETVGSFARQIENLKSKYPSVTTFILKPVYPKVGIN